MAASIRRKKKAKDGLVVDDHEKDDESDLEGEIDQNFAYTTRISMFALEGFNSTRKSLAFEDMEGDKSLK
jgi:hypothetical protein